MKTYKIRITKALDRDPFIRSLEAKIDQFLTSKNYTLGVNHIIPIFGLKYDLRYIRFIDPDSHVRREILINTDEKLVVAIEVDRKVQVALFSTEELRFFDKLGFKIPAQVSEESGQNIEDWYLKAEDKTITRDLSPLGYTKAKETYASWIDIWEKTVGDFYYKIHLYNSDYLGADKIDNTADKWSCESSMKNADTEFDRALFTNEELKYLDMIGYSLTAEFEREMKQSVEDWFTKS